MRRVVFDTNVLVDWINVGAHEDRILAKGQVRLLSSVVEMELRAGAFSPSGRRAVERIVKAHAGAARILCPTPAVFAAAGEILQRLRRRGIDVRRASLVDDVLIALSARSVGATVITRDHDFKTIRTVARFEVELIEPLEPPRRSGI